MKLEEAKEKARKRIAVIAKTRTEKLAMERGMTVLIDLLEDN